MFVNSRPVRSCRSKLRKIVWRKSSKIEETIVMNIDPRARFISTTFLCILKWDL